MMPRPDTVRYTAPSEYSNRTRKVDTLQIHHATTTSLSGLESLMAPGGRTVSANEAMASDGYRVGKVPPNKRAFTSATSFDNQSYTVEVCNTTLGPQWGISDAAHWALAKLAVELYREGMLGSLTRNHIIGHREVPGTYATACPGPSMNLDLIAQRARDIYAGTASEEYTPIEEDDMFTNDDRYNLAVIKQLLSEKEQWLGIGPGVTEIHKIVGEIRQTLTETQGWEGMDSRLTRLLGLVENAQSGNVDTEALAASIASKITVSAGASKADVQAVVSSELGKIFR